MTRPFPGRGGPVTLVAAALIVTALALPSAALAHAELATVTPADKSTLTEPPTEIVMTFTEALDPAKSSIVVVTASGAQVASGGVVSATDAKAMTLALPSLEAGAYEVRWTSASAQDGDLDRGSTAFTFAPAPSAAPTRTPSAPPSATAGASAAATPVPSAAPTASPAPSADTQPASSTADILIPIVVAVILVGGLGYWLLRGRSRSGGTP